jgi:uncharacterized membrane protein YhhN
MTKRILFVAYAALSVANVTAEALGATGPAKVTKAGLMPLLLAWLLVTIRQGHIRHQAPRWLAAGLAFAWLGDLMLTGQGSAYFMAGLAAFLAMQACYIVSFTRIPGPGLVRARKFLAVPYVAAWLLLNQVLAGGVGAMQLPVLVYSAVLVGMALAALDLAGRVDRKAGWLIAIGAPIFVASDGLIALTTFGPLSPSRLTDASIMATYVVAQGLIVAGLSGAVTRPPAESPVTP